LQDIKSLLNALVIIQRKSYIYIYLLYFFLLFVVVSVSVTLVTDIHCEPKKHTKMFFDIQFTRPDWLWWNLVHTAHLVIQAYYSCCFVDVCSVRYAQLSRAFSLKYGDHIFSMWPLYLWCVIVWFVGKCSNSGCTIAVIVHFVLSVHRFHQSMKQTKFFTPSGKPQCSSDWKYQLLERLKAWLN